MPGCSASGITTRRQRSRISKPHSAVWPRSCRKHGCRSSLFCSRLRKACEDAEHGMLVSMTDWGAQVCKCSPLVLPCVPRRIHAGRCGGWKSRQGDKVAPSDFIALHVLTPLLYSSPLYRLHQAQQDCGRVLASILDLGRETLVSPPELELRHGNLAAEAAASSSYFFSLQASHPGAGTFRTSHLIATDLRCFSDMAC